MSANKHDIAEIDFGYKMLEWKSKGFSAFEKVDCKPFDSPLGQIYIPVIQDYGTFEYFITGNKDGYTSYEGAARCIGRCLDKAKKAIDLSSNSV